jgi:hypothetical protein
MDENNNQTTTSAASIIKRANFYKQCIDEMLQSMLECDGRVMTLRVRETSRNSQPFMPALIIYADVPNEDGEGSDERSFYVWEGSDACEQLTLHMIEPDGPVRNVDQLYEAEKIRLGTVERLLCGKIMEVEVRTRADGTFEILKIFGIHNFGQR